MAGHNQMSTLTIVMYHYVRDLKHSRHPAIKGRTIEEFRRQLEYLERNHTIVRTEDVVAAAKGEAELPQGAAWLTFDDGYLDHYTNVLPLLIDRGWHGAFFPPAAAIEDRTILDVNKVQFILASEPDVSKLLEDIRKAVDSDRKQGSQHRFKYYWRDLARASRFDPAEITFIKKMLRDSLPENLRKPLVDEMFHKYVGRDDLDFAAELYMSQDQLRTMIDAGMYVGSHGHKHQQLDRMDDTTQAADIDASLRFLEKLGAPTAKDWVMCYPHGAYDDRLLRLLETRGCALGLGTRPGEADLGSERPLELSRLDTNDLPH